MTIEATLVYCNCVAPEVEALLGGPEYAGVKGVKIAEECDQPPYPASQLIAEVRRQGGEFPALLLGSDCILKPGETIPPDQLLCFSLQQCMEHLAGRQWVADRMAAGDHLSTLGQLQHWREAHRRWGFTEQALREYFAESTRRLVLIDSGLIDHADAEFQEFADRTDRPAEIYRTRADAFNEFIGLQLHNLELQRRVAGIDNDKRQLEQRLSEYAMLYDLVGKLTAFTAERPVIERLLELFTMLCAPRCVTYWHRASNECFSLPPNDRAQPCESLACFTAPHQVHPQQDGFSLTISRGEESFGVISLEGIGFPQYINHYLNLALSLAPVLGLALSNARTYQQRLDAEQRVNSLNVELATQLRQVQALNQELESFTYSVSHDLRAPLRSLDGFSHILARDYPEHFDERGRHHLQRIRANAQRMGQLIDDLLRLSRLTRGELEIGAVNLSATAGEVVESLRSAEPERAVEIHIPPGLHVEGDARLLRAALENLIGNAWKYTGKTDKPCIELGETAGEGERVIYVRDNGAGFNMEYADKLFTPFQRLHTEEEFPGTGIGLATVQRIIQRHGGRIWAESNPGEGSTFSFTLAEHSEEHADGKGAADRRQPR